MDLEEYIAATPDVKTEIHWWDLYKGHYVTMEKGLQQQLFSDSLDKVGGKFTYLGNKLGISRRTVAECFKLKRKPQIGTMLKLAEFIDFSKIEIERNIENIGKAFFRPKFPFKLHSIGGAEIRAAFLSDGHVPKHPTVSPIYSAYELELHFRLIRLCKKIFGDFNSEPRQGNKTPQTRFPAPIGAALELAGVPRGDKRLAKPFVPKDILMGSQEIKSSYLRRAFDDEGDICLSVGGRSKRAVRLTRVTNSSNNEIANLLLGEFLLLRQLGIDVKLYSEGTYKSKGGELTSKWRIQIGQQDSLRLFSDIINFNLKIKQEKLKNVLNSYKIKEFPNGVGETFSINVLKEVCAKKSHFEFRDLGKRLVETGRSYDLAGRYLRILLEKGKIKKIKRGVYVFK